ncbi:MAG: hypothetical protein E6G34_10165 [Actinobacteria bacterium]|nr:MAG: hypothetical protein E6G34_10165 [Actinomycetota bacterium]
MFSHPQVSATIRTPLGRRGGLVGLLTVALDAVRPRRISRIAAALCASGLFAAVMPAVAAASCPTTTSSTALAQFGDNASYYLLAGSTFETGTSGWSLNHAAVIGEKTAIGGSHAVAIEPNGTATSPEFCVSSEYPSFRFFAHQVGGYGGYGSSLNVSLRWTDSYGYSHQVTVATLQPNSSWTLSPVLQLASALPLWMPGSTLKVKLVLQPGYAAKWAVADVYIDPYTR